jgi:CRISPR-associated protein Cmr6
MTKQLFAMSRKALPQAIQFENAGLLFDKGFRQWSTDNAIRGDSIATQIQSVVKCANRVPEIYKLAYQRWVAETSHVDSAQYFTQLESRLYIGVGMAHILETQITRNRSYGMPIIPGSAVKGLVRAMAGQFEIEPDAANTLFGSEPGAEKPQAGYLLFHDAWWVPEQAKSAYAAEIITEHANKYYQSKGADFIHPDLESPNPNNQIAARGSFYFVIEGKQQWATLAMGILKDCLSYDGIGAKVNSGYGYFIDADDDAQMAARRSTAAIEQHQQAIQYAANEQAKAAIEASLIARLSDAQKHIKQLRDDLELGVASKDEFNQKVNRLVEIANEKQWSELEKNEFSLAAEAVYQRTLVAKKRATKLNKVRAKIELPPL